MKVLYNKIPNNIFGKYCSSPKRKQYPNLMPLQKDIVSFSSKVKAPEKSPIIINDLNDPVLDSIQPVTKNHDCYVVGGYMRDYFNGRKKSHDWDLVCTDSSKALADEIAELRGGTVVPLDDRYGIYRVVLNDKVTEFDIAQAQQNDIEVDCHRRDLTINSIFYNLNTHEVYDPFNGVSDIENKVIRTASLDNIKADPLRILRVYRFIAKTGFKVDEGLAQCCRENVGLLDKISRERIYSEIMNILSAPYLKDSLNKMQDDGLLRTLFPSLPENDNTIRNAINQTEKIPREKPLLKLIALLSTSKKSLDEIETDLKNLKFTKKQVSFITKMLENRITQKKLNQDDTKKAFAEIIKSLDDDTEDAIILAKAQFDDDKLEELHQHFTEIKSTFPDYKPLLNGKEIVKVLGIKPSKQIGIISNELLMQQLMGNVKTTEDAVEFIRNNLLNLNQ